MGARMLLQSETAFQEDYLVHPIGLAFGHVPFYWIRWS